tara:strand:- start:1045 stop:1287 length:243 start_codon:yes stop_codon:yes gene_type:complete
MSKDKEDIFIGKYHPFPKEAPKSWRMARMKELRKEVEAKRKIRERQWHMMEQHTLGWGYLIGYLAVFGVVCLMIKELWYG